MPSHDVEKALIDKAIKVHVSYCKRSNSRFDQPSEYESDVEDVNGVLYVSLRNMHGLLAAYRVRPETLRMRLVSRKNWPSSLVNRA